MNNTVPSIGERVLAYWQQFDDISRKWANPFCQRDDGQVNEKAVNLLAAMFKVAAVATVAFSLYLMWENPILSLAFFGVGCILRLQPETIQIIKSQIQNSLHDSIVAIQLHEQWIEKIVMVAATVAVAASIMTSLIPPIVLSSFIGYQVRPWILPRYLQRATTTDAQTPVIPLPVSDTPSIE